MLAKGFNLVNINDILVYVRTGEKMFERRSNPEYIKSWFVLQKKMYQYNLINILDFFINMINIVVFIYIPPRLKKYIYKLLLRSNYL